ncbi:monocarboxylate transporter, putative [Pediculus humanus corporis]|uniref:Monocarboxylate transporter, putative n=1 Tax=Pediculus humanus subsp. corporis TaxID=121224 RepID=E0VHJ4_PEDHC|nr:monocarboxylate transporter, putative [Pediculus humanus corporis]EEB12880.1 monocarboxylate transporter, putative [Pediculus humanus corporis]
MIDFVTALVGSLGIGMTFFLSPVAGILTDQIGIRMTTFLGGTLAIGGLVLSSFFSNNVEVLYASFGIILGVGASLAYSPSLIILGHYFTKYLGVANGFATAGSSVFTLAFPYFLQALIDNFELKGCFLGVSFLMILILVCALVFKPVLKKSPKPKKRHGFTFKSKFKSIINVEIWKIRKFLIWIIALPVSLFGYFVTFVHLVSYVNVTFNEEYDGKILIQCIAATSLLGRLISGKVADFKKVNTITLQQISFVCLGLLTMLIAVVQNYYGLIVICLSMGIFDGCFVSLMGPVAFKICGQKGASQAIGFLLGLCAIPMTLGPPMAGFIFDQTESYTTSFIIAGSTFLLGASIMQLIHCVGDDKSDDDIIIEPVSEGQFLSLGLLTASSPFFCSSVTNNIRTK